MLTGREISPIVIVVVLVVLVVALAGAWITFFSKGSSYYGGKRTVPKAPPGASGALAKPPALPAEARNGR